MGFDGLREQNCRNARQPANGHRRVLGGRNLMSSCFLYSDNYESDTAYLQ
jgi:hypothetical protein